MTRELELISSVTQFAPNRVNPDATRVAKASAAAEADGYDTVLVGYNSNRPEGFGIANEVFRSTSKLRVLLAHRPGMMSPSLAARTISTLDVFSGGRLSINVVTGGSAIDQHREGDYADHDQRYERSIEYMDVLRQCWTQEEAFDFEGRFYKVENVRHDLQPLQKPYVPLYMGGSSDMAMVLAERHADVFMSWSEPVAAVASRFEEVRGRLAGAGKTDPGLSVSMRLVFGDTEDEAWDAAYSIVSNDDAEASAAKRKFHAQDVGRNRQLQFAKEGLVHDERLWMGIAALTGGLGSTGALVGTAEQVTESLLAYVRAGANALLLTGPDGAYCPFPDGFLANLRVRANEVLAESAAHDGVGQPA